MSAASRQQNDYSGPLLLHWAWNVGKQLVSVVSLWAIEWCCWVLKPMFAQAWCYKRSFHWCWYGDESKPIIPCFGGWTSTYQLFWCSPGCHGFDPWPLRFDLCLPTMVPRCLFDPKTPRLCTMIHWSWRSAGSSVSMVPCLAAAISNGGKKIRHRRERWQKTWS